MVARTTKNAAESSGNTPNPLLLVSRIVSCSGKKRVGVVAANGFGCGRKDSCLAQPSTSLHQVQGTRRLKMSISFRDAYTTHGVENYYTLVASSYKNPHEPGVQKCLRQILESIVPGKSILFVAVSARQGRSKNRHQNPSTC